MPEIPAAYWHFFLGGVLLLVLLVPLRVLWDATRDSRERREKNRATADRLKECLAGVEFLPGRLGRDRIRFRSEEGAFTLTLVSSKMLRLRIDGDIAPKFHVWIGTRTAGWRRWKFLGESCRILRRFPTHDPLLDRDVSIYATPAFGAYLRELALEGIPLEGKPAGIAESLLVISKLPGTRRFRITMSPRKGMRLHLRLRTEDVFFRPDEMETAAHHLGQLYRALVLD